MFTRFVLLSVCLVLIAACAPALTPAPVQPTAAPAQPTTAAAPAPAPALSGKLTLMIHPTLYNVTGGKDGFITQFTKDTGVQVEVVTAQSADIREKILIEGVAQSGRFDLYPIQDSWVNPELVRFLEPLDSYLANVEPAFKPQDLIQALVNAYKSPQGTGPQYGIPWRVGTAMLYYRKDLLEKANVKVPTNWDEFLAAAKALTQDTNGDGKTDVYGVAADLYPGGSQMLRFMLAHGGDFLTPDWSACAVNSPQGVAALELVSKIYQSGYVDKEALAWERDPVIAALQQGRAAMTITYSPYWSLLTDPKAGDAAKQMGWAIVPTSPGVTPGRTLNDGWAWAIDKNSKNKQAAWALIKILTGPAGQLKMALDFANGPVRTSVYESQEYLTKIPPAKDWLKATAASVVAPAHPRYPEMRDIYNEEAAKAYRAQKTAKQAMDDACTRINAVLKK